MPRTKVKIAFIENDTKRNVTFNKRAIGLVKSTQELSVLCGIDCCLILKNPSKDQPMVWPSEPHEVKRVLSKYTDLPKNVKDQNKFNQEVFIRKMVQKVEKKCRKLMNENRQRVGLDLVWQCLAGHGKVDKLSMKDLADMSKVIEEKLKDISKVMENPKPESTTQGNNGKEVIVIPDTPDQNEMTLAEPNGLGKGKEVMDVFPFDLNKVKTEKDDPDIAGTWWEDPFRFPSVINKRGGAGPSGHP